MTIAVGNIEYYNIYFFTDVDHFARPLAECHCRPDGHTSDLIEEEESCRCN